MPTTLIDSAIFGDVFSTDPMRRVWSDENRAQKYLDIEATLARVQARLGVIPREAAEEINRHCRIEEIDLTKLKRDAPMIGRSNLQQAVPITFGYKMAALLAAVERHCQRLSELRPRVLVGEFGGACGTLASLQKGALETQAGLMKELELGVPEARQILVVNRQGVGSFDGKMVDKAVARKARLVLERAGITPQD
jgi:adenylosuccinate lyase